MTTYSDKQQHAYTPERREERREAKRLAKEMAREQYGGHAPHTSRGEAQQRALVDAAYHLIAEGGFETLRTRDVAARAGVNIATLHYYFATKEDLIGAVVQRVHYELATMHSPAFDNNEMTPLQELREEFLDMQFQLQHAPETYLVLFELFVRSRRDPKLSAMLREMEWDWRNHIESYLAEGVRQGVFRADLDIPAAAATLAALIKGSIMHMLNDAESYPAARIEAEIERWITGHAVAQA